MTTTKRALAILLAPLTLILGNAAMANRSTEELSCEIRSKTVSGVLQLDAVASAGAQVSGEYEFVISKAGASGSSDVTQGGEFAIEPGEPALLGEVALGADEGGSVRAVLTVTAADGRSCQSRFPAAL